MVENIKINKIQLNKGQLEGLPKNPRFIRDERFKALVKSIEDAPEMLALRELLVYPFLDSYIVIGGNMRLRACKELGYKEVPCKVLPRETPVEKLREYTIKDNNGFGQNDWDLLSNEWEVAELEDWGMELNFDEDYNPGEEEAEEEEKKVVEDEVPDVDEEHEPICQRGDIWQLGRHRLMCGDSTSEEEVAKLMDGKKADMVFTDPPYGMKKEADGVLNDNLNYDDLLEFNKRWIPLSFSNLKNNGSWYCWGIIEPLMDIYSHILKPMTKENKITFRNLITWKKGAFGSGGGTGVGQAIQRSYFPETEHCIFVMCGVQGFNNNADNYFEAWKPIRKYLYDERIKCGWDVPQMKEIAGHSNKNRDHWTNKSQWSLVPEYVYVKFQQWAREHNVDAFKREYDEIKREYYATRAYFNNTHDMMTDVWEFQRSRGEERALCGGHATPKPIALCSRAIKTSSRENESVLDVFGGSGSTLIACEQLNRTCYTMELDPKYCDVIIKRWETLTGNTAKKIN